MNDIAYQVASYLQNAGFGTLGTSIFVGQLPADTNGLYVIRSGGQMNNYVPIEETAIDVYVKNIKSELAVDLLERIKQYIHRTNNFTIGNMYIFTILVIGDVEDVMRDDEYAKIYKITLEVVHRNTNLIS